MSTYSNQEKVEGQIKRPLTESELVNFDTIVEAQSDMVSKYLNRYWNDIDAEEDPEETVRYFDGSGLAELFIDDFQSLSKVEFLDGLGDVFQTLDDDSIFVYYPLNATTKQSLHIRGYRFPCSPASVKLTGVFTSGTVPSAIVMAVTALISNQLLFDEVVGEFESENIEGYSYKIKTQSQGDLDKATTKILTSIEGYQKVLI